MRRVRYACTHRRRGHSPRLGGAGRAKQLAGEPGTSRADGDARYRARPLRPRLGEVAEDVAPHHFPSHQVEECVAPESPQLELIRFALVSALDLQQSFQRRRLLLDLPAEESCDFVSELRRHGLDNICLVAPTSTEARIKKIVRDGSGFVYCVAREGVTGKMDGITGASTDLVRRTRRHTGLPLALGFGIATPDQARAAARSADAIVVGSAIVRAYHEAPSTRAGRKKVERWLGSLVEAAHST